MFFESLLFNLLLLVVVHWISDFLFQTDAMAINKSTSVKWLSLHVCAYMFPLFIFGWQFALINGAVHWGVDFFTSKWAAHYNKQGKVGHMFKVIGFDQALHMVTLLATFFWLFV